MPETVNWTYSVRAQNGPSMAGSGNMSVEAYEKLSLALAGGNVAQNVSIGPGTWADIQSLIVNPSDATGVITLAPTGGSTIALNGPLLLIGTGAVALLGSGTATLVLTNTGATELAVDIFVARDATP